MSHDASLAAGTLARFLDGDVWHSFRSSPLAIGAALTALLCIVAALGAPWLAPHDPYDLAAIDLSDARLPPAWMEGGSSRFWLGTDGQGRDILSTIMYGTRISLLVGLAAVAMWMVAMTSTGPVTFGRT